MIGFQLDIIVDILYTVIFEANENIMNLEGSKNLSLRLFELILHFNKNVAEVNTSSLEINL